MLFIPVCYSFAQLPNNEQEVILYMEKLGAYIHKMYAIMHESQNAHGLCLLLLLACLERTHLI